MKKTLVVILVVIMCLMATLPLVGCAVDGTVNPATFTSSTKYLLESSTNAPSATLTNLRQLNASSLRNLLSLFDLYSIANDLQISRTNFGFPAIN